MSVNREQKNAAKKVEVALKKALVAFGNYDAAQDDFVKADAAAKNAKDIARKAKDDVKKADVEYLEASKTVLALAKAAYVAGKKGAPKTVEDSLPTAEEVYQDDDGYATDVEGFQYLTPEEKPIPVADMFRKIEAQDWNA